MCRRVGKSHTILFLIYPFLLSSLFSLCPASLSHPLLSHLTFCPLLSCSLLINLFLFFFSSSQVLATAVARYPAGASNRWQSVTHYANDKVRTYLHNSTSFLPTLFLRTPLSFLVRPVSFPFLPLLFPLYPTSLYPITPHLSYSNPIPCRLILISLPLLFQILPAESLTRAMPLITQEECLRAAYKQATRGWTEWEKAKPSYPLLRTF